MTSQTTAQSTPTARGPKAPTPQAQALLGKRDARIEAAVAEQKVGDAARGKGDKKGSLSSGGRLANRTREIREVEDDLAELGFEVEPYVLAKSNGKQTLESIPQSVLEERIANCWKAYQEATFESTKGRMDDRIKGLLVACEKRGYKVTDPRPAKKPTAA